jgi:DNA-binding beta-propeller fold protein YncE
MDQSLKRGSRRAALDQFWTANVLAQGGTVVGTSPRLVKSDGEDLWVASFGDNWVARVRASDGKFIEAWTGATNAFGVLVAGGLVFVTGRTNPGSLYGFDPSTTPGAVSSLSLTLGANPAGIAYDGENIWTANSALGPGTGSVSKYILFGSSTFTFSTGFSQPIGILYDGTYIWVTDTGDGTLKKLNSSGIVIQTVIVGTNPQFPAFDGTNIWVPNLGNNTVTVVRAVGALAGSVLATLNGNGLDSPRSAAFDGERVLVTNSVSSVSIWKATDLSLIGAFSLGSSNTPFGACSDGLNFWITQSSNGRLVRF